MNWIPLVILFALTMIGLGVEGAKHGQKRDEVYNIWTSLVAVAIRWALILWAVFG